MLFSVLFSLVPVLVQMRFPVVTITLADVLPMAIVVAVQSFHYEAGCPFPILYRAGED